MFGVMFIDVGLGMGLGIFGLLAVQLMVQMLFSTSTFEDWESIIVLDDQDTYGASGYLLNISPSERKRIEGGESILDVVLSNDSRWIRGEL